MKKTLKNYTFKGIAFLLSFLMVFYIFPVSVLADMLGSDNDLSDVLSPINDSPSVIELFDLREERVKHFKLADGTYIAAQYDIPIHYLNEDGTWSDIDNTLNEEGLTSLSDMSGYAVENKAKVKFANNTNSSKTLAIKYGNYKISFGLIDANKK